MKVEWTRPALSDLIEAQAHIAKENQKAAKIVAHKVWDASLQLANNPEIGRTGHVDGTREWVVGQTPYLIVYRVNKNQIEILRVWHSRLKWQSEDEAYANPSVPRKRESSLTFSSCWRRPV